MQITIRKADMVCVITGLVYHRQSGNPPFHEDAQSFDYWRVRVNEGDVTVRPDAQLFQGLLHEGRLWHLTHLMDATSNVTFTH